MNPNTNTPATRYSKARHEAIHAVKGLLKAKPRTEGAATLHVLYNLLRGVALTRGFTWPKQRGRDTTRAFLLASRHVVARAKALGLELEPTELARLADTRRQVCLSNADFAQAAGDRVGQLAAYREAMRMTPHGPHSTVAVHGQDCWRIYANLVWALKHSSPGDSRPQWLREHGQELLAAQLPGKEVQQYLVYHDIGKVTTLKHGADGKLHFPGHAAASEQLWKAGGGSELQAQLMGLDMVLHTATPEEAMARIPLQLQATLLLATYAQLLSNARSIFGGTESTSYKAKQQALDKRAQALCGRLFASA